MLLHKCVSAELVSLEFSELVKVLIVTSLEVTAKVNITETFTWFP